MTAALTTGLVSSSRFFPVNFKTIDWALLEIVSESKSNKIIAVSEKTENLPPIFLL